jgi:hypothetical protein
VGAQPGQRDDAAVHGAHHQVRGCSRADRS